MKQVFLLLVLFGSASCTEILLEPEVETETEENVDLPPEEEEEDTEPVIGVDYYVATWGNDGSSGSFESPFATWERAFSVAVPGDTIIIRGGEYKPSETVLFTGKKGTSSEYIVVRNYPEETPVLNCENIPANGNSFGLIISNCSYLVLQGLTISGVKQSSDGSTTVGCLISRSNNLILDQMVSRDHGGSGFYLEENDDLLLKNIDVFNNYDRYTSGYPGGHADGIGITGSGRNIHARLVGCRAWNNSDDGFDCYNNEGIVIFDRCWAFENGYDSGDGMGFKLGKTNMEAMSEVQRVVMNCIAAENKSAGFNENHANVKTEIYNNSSYSSNIGYVNYQVNTTKEDVIYKNNLAYGGGQLSVLFRSVVIEDHNNWNLTSVSSLSDQEFRSLDLEELYWGRQEDGSLPEIDFLRPVAASLLNEMGVDVGLSFSGDAPYIGALEGH